MTNNKFQDTGIHPYTEMVSDLFSHQKIEDSQENLTD